MASAHLQLSVLPGLSAVKKHGRGSLVLTYRICLTRCRTRMDGLWRRLIKSRLRMFTSRFPYCHGYRSPRTKKVLMLSNTDTHGVPQPSQIVANPQLRPKPPVWVILGVGELSRRL